MKRLAGHQPYFMPYIGYYSIMNAVDIFVYGDNLQYKRHGWSNRNRIISENGKWKYITVPVKRRCMTDSYNEVEVDNSVNWQKNMINQLGYYKKNAPYYNDVIELLNEVFDQQCSTISDLNIKSNGIVSKKLDINTEIYTLSEIDNCKKHNCCADELGVWVSKDFPDVDEYWNAPDGRFFYDIKKYHNANLDIKFVQNRLSPYEQGTDEFIPGLSIIDVMMFNSEEQIKVHLKDFDFV